MSHHKNAGLLFYRGYYQNIDFVGTTDSVKEANTAAFKEANRLLTSIPLPSESPAASYEKIPGTQGFQAQTQYPGLILGSGYQHETRQEGELKLGFFFDHTTGLPVIPGSSIKGLLRSAFSHPALIGHLLGRELSPAQVEQLALAIFEGKEPTGELDEAGNPEYAVMSMSRHDTFFDAFPVAQEGEKGVFAEDFLTPHAPGQSDGAFKNPIPISFLKVRAGISYRFLFRLHDSQELGVSAKEKLSLFEQLILTLGLGAKTSVGYGQFTNSQKKMEIEPSVSSGQRKPGLVEEPVPPLPAPKNEDREMRLLPLEKMRRGREVEARVTAHQGRQLLLQLGFEGYEEIVRVQAAVQLFPVGTLCKVQVNNVQGKGAKARVNVASPKPKDIIFKPEP
ncbi:MAG: type III-B CRISPR module RAMP protein Cmr6 [Bacteroidota bacterium]